MRLKILLVLTFGLIALVVWQRLRYHDFSTVTGALGGVLGYFIGDDMGVSLLGTGIGAEWLMVPLLFALGGMVHVTDRRAK